MKFNVFSPEEIEAYSVMEVVIPGTMNGEDEIEGSINDPRMGPVYPGQTCKSCLGTIKTCPGHMSYITLCKPVYNVLFMDNIYKCLKRICLNCGHLRIHRQECFSCHTQHGKLRRETVHSLSLNKDPFSSLEAQEALKRIRTEDLPTLGIKKRPEHLIITNLLVLPPCARPSVQRKEGSWSCDPLTYKYSEIIKCNNVLKSLLFGNMPPHIIRDTWRVLQWHVSTLLDNSIPVKRLSNERRAIPMKGLKQRQIKVLL